MSKKYNTAKWKDFVITRDFIEVFALKLMNAQKIAILNILYNEGEHTISELQRLLNISYKETYRHIKELIDIGILERNKKINEKHQPVYIRIKKGVIKPI